MPAQRLALGQRLAKRLLPLALLIGCCISFGLPATFYGIGLAALQRTATVYAHELAKNLERHLVVELQSLWKYQVPKFGRLLQDFLPYRDVVRIRVLDETGRPIVGYEHTTTEDQVWWNLHPPLGSAPISFNDRVVGTVEVYVSRRMLPLVTLSLLVGCTAVGVSLAVFVYAAPMRVVYSMERQIADLIGNLQRSNVELERHAAENAHLVETLQHTLDNLKTKNAELDRFVYSVSHDLKAPLVTLQGMSSLLLEDYGEKLDEEGRYYIERLQVNTQHMERLIMDLLALSRIGREARAPEDVSLDEVVDDCLTEQAETMRTRGVQVSRGALGTLWAVRTQMLQIIGNLLGNAVKYLGDTPVPRVDIGTVDRDAYVECYVKDNGIGIDPVDFSLRDLLGQAIKTLALRAHEKSLELAYYIQPEVPDALRGDAGRLRQIVLNLVGNAIKFTTQGEVVVEVCQAPEALCTAPATLPTGEEDTVVMHAAIPGG